MGLQQFPEDFVKQPNEGEPIDLPPGEIQLGTAMMEGGSLLRAGTIRIGGPSGEIKDVGTVSKGRFLEAMALCHRSGNIKLPDDEICDRAVNDFNKYRQNLENQFTNLASQRTFDQQRQRAVFNALFTQSVAMAKKVKPATGRSSVHVMTGGPAVPERPDRAGLRPPKAGHLTIEVPDGTL